MYGSDDPVNLLWRKEVWFRTPRRADQTVIWNFSLWNRCAQMR
jgi:hypothetical protein